MRIAVLGASGRTGRQVVRHALDAGHTVNALFRDASASPPAQPNLRVVAGLATVRGAVVDALSDAVAAISALGP